MTLNDYIESIKSVDMTELRAGEAYEKLMKIGLRYYEETGDDLLRDCSDARDRSFVQKKAEYLLRYNGWAEVVSYFSTLPERAFKDSYFYEYQDHLYTVRFEDVDRLREMMIRKLQEKDPNAVEKEQLTQVVQSLAALTHKLEELINKEESK